MYEMKTSELITMLQDKIKQFGDIPVRYEHNMEDQLPETSDKYGNAMPAGGVFTITDEKDGKEIGLYNVIGNSEHISEMSN